MPIVEMPDGAHVQFPDDMPREQIRDLIASKFPKETGYSHLTRAFTDIPSEIANEFKAGVGMVADAPNRSSFDIASGPMGAVRAATSWITGPAMSLGGHGLAAASHGIGAGIDLLRGTNIAARDNPQQMYDELKIEAPKALGALGGSFQALRAGFRPPPTAPTPNGPLGVTLSEGQATRSLPAIQREQAALRASDGAAGERAREFAAQQAGQVASARERISQGFDPFNQTIAQTPQEAAQLVQQSLQREAASRRAGIDQLYKDARALPGEIPADTVKAIGDHIKLELSSRPEPIVIDDKLTPYASYAIRDIETRISNLQVQNRAHPLGRPPQNQIAGITLEGLDQQRKRLVTFRRDAYNSGNASDGRAAAGVIEAFDNFIDSAINSGAFTGDPLAVKAWNTARAAHADYKTTFGKQPGNPVGRIVEKIVGSQRNPAAIPNDVADYLYGATGINPNSTNVGVSNRIKGILGEQSPEWSAVKQGLFARLTETPQGVTDFGPGKVAQRVGKFLSDGKELSEAVYSPAQLSLIRQYGELNRALEVPQAGANWSNTSTVVVPVIKRVGAQLAATIGAAIGHVVSPGVGELTGAAGGYLTGKLTGAINESRQAAQIAKQMPLVTEATKKWQKALAAYNRANTPPSRVALGVATSNMARAFKQIGIDLQGGPVLSSAQQDQQENPRPPGQ